MFNLLVPQIFTEDMAVISISVIELTARQLDALLLA